MITVKFSAFMAIAVSVTLFTACDDDDDIDDFEDVIDARVDELDLDDDFVVTQSEWNDAFVVWDDDDDQLLVLREFRFNGGGFAAADLNSDGYVTGDEWEQLLDSWDTNSNGELDEIEFDPYL